ncbi:MAG: hypothetical protein FJZ01_16460 [Candidatus Sericytochromatia bacterium]|nr:hypothetical protein [Candidatus Tanganyikabacteria bacterium]
MPVETAVKSRMAAPVYEPIVGEELLFRLETTTPIYGGGFRARRPDEVDIVRVPGIRGQLRQWWRALHAGAHADLASAERKLWGGIAGGDQGQRSLVDLAIKIVGALPDLDSGKVELQARDAYALFPANMPLSDIAPRRRPGVRFDLSVRFDTSLSPARRGEVLGALRAWVLFGGVGGRTRRGCGSLAYRMSAGAPDLPDSGFGWLPQDLSTGALCLAPGQVAKPFPTLRGARFFLGPPHTGNNAALQAWHEALAWLRDFRQASSQSIDTADPGRHARRRPVVGQGLAARPGQTRWPEADKIRRLYLARNRGFTLSHPLVFNATPVWPRAQFGLPIQVQFQRTDRGGAKGALKEPDNVSLTWRTGPGQEARQRLASPLIVKPIQLPGGAFAALALWLYRALPPSAEVGVADGKGLLAGSAAPIAAMTAAGDPCPFTALAAKASVQEAFFDWLAGQCPGGSGGTL